MLGEVEEVEREGAAKGKEENINALSIKKHATCVFQKYMSVLTGSVFLYLCLGASIFALGFACVLLSVCTLTPSL